MKIIGFTGKKQSGKSTASAYVEQLTGATRINFKDALVEEITTLFPELLQAIIDVMDVVAYDGMDRWTVEKLFRDKPAVMRRLMQNFGTNVRRGEDSLYWVNKWEEKVANTKGMVIVDDVRFMNEARAVIANGGIIIRIEREGQENTDTHISEIEMDCIHEHFCIHAKTGDFNTLYAEINKILYGESSPDTHLLINNEEGVSK
jgi:hypothetical protein